MKSSHAVLTCPKGGLLSILAGNQVCYHRIMDKSSFKSYQKKTSSTSICSVISITVDY